MELNIRRSPTGSGFVNRADFNTVIGACRTIGAAIYQYPHQGETVDGIDYLPMDLLVDPEDIKNALEIINAYFKFLR